jgi:hypothetical protein
LVKETALNEAFLRLFSPEKKAVKDDSEYSHLYKQLAQLSTFPGQFEIHNPIEEGIAIEWALEGNRMRKVVRRSNYRSTGKFPGKKNSRMMQWESHLELASFRILEICPHVTSFREQPARITYCDETNVTHLHYPDISVVLRSGTEVFLEIKPESAKQDMDLMRRTSLLQRLLYSKGYYYLLVFPDQLESGFYLNNAIELLYHSNRPLSEGVVESIRRIFREHNQLKLASLIMFLGNESARSSIYKMLMSGYLVCDLSKPLNAETPIFWSESEVA